MRIEQLDAHVKSYRDYLKKKKREHILNLLKDLQSQRKRLLLGEHPVPRINYTFNMVRSSLVLPRIPDKVSFSSTVKLQNDIVNINYDYRDVHTSYSEPTLQNPSVPHAPSFSFKNFKFESAHISTSKFTDAIYEFNGISYTPKRCTLNIKKFDDIELNSAFIADYSLPELPILKLKPASFNIYTSSITSFVPPKGSFSFNKIAIESFSFKKFNYRYTSPKLSVFDFSKQHISSGRFQTDLKKLYDEVNIDKTDNSFTIPQFNLNVKVNDIKMEKKEFPKPDLDFTDVLARFQHALYEDLSKGEQYEK